MTLLSFQSMTVGNTSAVREFDPNRNTQTMARAWLLTRFGKISDTMIQLSGASPTVKEPAASIIGTSMDKAGACNARSVAISRWLKAMPTVLAISRPRRL